MELRKFISILLLLAPLSGTFGQNPFVNPSFEFTSDVAKDCQGNCEFPDNWKFDDCNPEGAICRQTQSTDGSYGVGISWTANTGCCTTYADIWQDNVDLSGICEIAIDQIGPSGGNPQRSDHYLYIDGTQVKDCGYMSNGQRDTCYLDVSGFNGSHTFRVQWNQRTLDNLGNSVLDNVRVTSSESTTPSGIDASKNPICKGDSVTLSVQGGKLGVGADWHWYDASCGSGSIGMGDSLTVAPGSPTTYYVRAENSCNITSCDSIKIDTAVTPKAPTSASASPNPICAGDTSILSQSGGSLGPSGTWEWYKGSCGGTWVGSGDSLKVTPSSTNTYYVRAEGNCDTSACESVTLTTDPSPNMDAGLDRWFCRGDTITIGGASATGGTTPYSFSWTNSSSLSDGSIENPDAFPDSTTDYKVTVTDANGCSDSDSLNITVYDNPSVSFSGLDSLYCSNNKVDTLFGSEAPSGDFFGNGVSDLGNGKGLFDPNAVSSGTYEVYYRFTTSNNCTDTDTQEVIVREAPKLDDNNLIRIKATCGMSNGSLENMLVGGGTPPYSFEWTNSSGQVVDSTLDLTDAPTGDYWIQVTDSMGCSHSLGPYFIGEIGGPKAHAGTDTIFCEGDSTTIGDSIAASDGTPPYEYEWTPGRGLSDSTIAQPSASPSKSTPYTLTVTDSNDCKARDTVLVGIYQAPDLETGDTIKTCKAKDARLGGDPTAQNGHPPYDYFWSNPTALSNDTVPNPIASPNDSTVYPLFVSDSLGCTARDTAWVLIDKRHCAGPHIFVPNAFSPNGDGVNDELLVKGKDIASFHLRIFNRWGQQVFSTQKKSLGWDGTFAGEHLDPAVFVYKVTGLFENGERFEKSGNITLLK